MTVDKSLLYLLTIVFTLYNIVRGIITLDYAYTPTPALIAMAIYAVASATSLVSVRHGKLPMWAVLVNLAAAITVPLLVTSQLDGGVDNGYATWHVTSIGVLMVMTIVFRREIAGWIGIAFLTLQTSYWAGTSEAVQAGISGVVLWGILASVLTRGLERAHRHAIELDEAAREAALWRATQDAQRRVRSEQLDRAATEAVPLLREVILSGGVLSAQGRAEAALLESSLRDDIRGRALITPGVRREVTAARRRGMIVSVLDDGGFEGMTDESRERVLAVVEREIANAECSSLVLRTGPPESDVAVTIVGVRESVASASGDDIGPGGASEGVDDASAEDGGSVEDDGSAEDDSSAEDDEVTVWTEIRRDASVDRRR